MRLFSFAVSSGLALTGISLSVFGIGTTDFKLIGIGLVMIMGAGVFATLYLGTRKGAVSSPYSG